MGVRENTILNLKQDIYHAYGSLRYPGDSKLLHENCRDNSDILKFYGQKDWTKISDSIIQYENAALCFFSPEAYQFFLPRYLVYVLDNYSEEYFTVDTTIYSLTPDGETRDFQITKYSLLTQDQINCVKSFLQLCLEELSDDLDPDEVRQALNYWKEK